MFLHDIRIIVGLSTIFLFVGCNDKIVDGNKIQQRNGIVYEVNHEEPFTGKIITSYKEGQKKEEITIVNGYMDGLAIRWYKNGQKHIETHFKQGYEEGVHIEWYENGQKEVEKYYKNGKRDGKYISWYKDGQKNREIIYKNGKQISGIKWFTDGKEEFNCINKTAIFIDLNGTKKVSNFIESMCEEN